MILFLALIVLICSAPVVAPRTTAASQVASPPEVVLALATSSMTFGSQVSQQGASQDIRKFNLKDFAYREAVRTLRQDWAEAVKSIEEQGDKGGEDDWVQAKKIQSFGAKPIYGDLTGDGSDEAAVSVKS